MPRRWGVCRPRPSAPTLRSAAVFASASLYEPFGLGFWKRPKRGCALVLSDIPTFRELWDGAAVFAPPHDDQAFADAIQSAVRQQRSPHRPGAGGQERAARFTVEAMTAGVLDVYATLTPSARLSPRQEAAA
jgi:glycogen(starch) synthase